MSQEQAHHDPKPVTYGDLFNVQGDLASQPVTKQDVSLMESAESLATFPIKDGAASKMQSAASKNLESGAITPETHSIVPQEGVAVIGLTLPENVQTAEYIAGQPVQVKETVPPSTDPVNAKQDDITSGENPEVAEVGSGDKPVEFSDAR